MRLHPTDDLSACKDWINQAYRRAALETEALVTSTTVSLTPGTATYDLSSLAAAVLRIKSILATTGDVLYQPLRLVPLDEILRRRVGTGGASSITGPTTHYALAGLNDLEIYPTPSAATTLTIYYVAAPTALSADGDVPVFPEPHATELLESGAMASAADFKADPYAASYDAAFQQAIARFRQHLNRRRGGQPGELTWALDGVYPPHDPATILPWGY